MENALTRWLAREQAWALERNKKKKKELLIWIVSVPIVLPLIPILLSGVLSGATAFADILNSIKFALLFAAGLDLLLLACMLPQMPGRQYMKWLKIYLNGAFASDAEREKMAAQMMGDQGVDSVICIPWKESGIGEQRIWVTRDYLLSTRGNGRLNLIFLNEINTIETDRTDITYHTGSGSTRVNVKDELYTLTFIYGENTTLPQSVREFREGKVILNYPTREIRDAVVKALKALRPESIQN